MDFEQLRQRNIKAAAASAAARKKTAKYPDLTKIAVYRHTRDAVNKIAERDSISVPMLIEKVIAAWKNKEL